MKKLISVMVLFVFLTLTTMAMASQVTILGRGGHIRRVQVANSL